MIVIIYQRLQTLTGCLRHGVPLYETNHTYKIRKNLNVQTLRDNTEIQLYTCVPVLKGSNITVYWGISGKVNFLQSIADSLRILHYRAMSGHQVLYFNSTRSQVQTTQPYSRSIAHPSSTVDVLYPQCHADTMPPRSL